MKDIEYLATLKQTYMCTLDSWACFAYGCEIKGNTIQRNYIPLKERAWVVSTRKLLCYSMGSHQNWKWEFVFKNEETSYI